MKIIGITGQTGAGKSTVCQALEKTGYYHIDADLVAREVIDKSKSVKEALSLQFGADILLPDGKIDRKALAKKAFKTKKSAERLSEITHPAVIDEIKKIIKKKQKEKAKGVLIDAIGLFDSGLSELCDFTVSVTAPEPIRLQRIVSRDKISQDEAEKRIKAQKDEAYFVENADLVINNDGKNEIECEIKRILAYEQS